MLTMHARPATAPASPVPLDHHEKLRIRAAAFRATRLYPGPVGQFVSRELLTWEEFGYRFDAGGMAGRLVDHVLKTPLPGAPVPGSPPADAPVSVTPPAPPAA